jgi:hypothetical protein
MGKKLKWTNYPATVTEEQWQLSDCGHFELQCNRHQKNTGLYVQLIYGNDDTHLHMGFHSTITSAKLAAQAIADLMN